MSGEGPPGDVRATGATPAGPDRQHADADALARINRVLRTLRAGHRALLRAGDEQGLLARMCRVIVDEGGYALAWIGYAEDDAARTIRCVGHAGTAPKFPAQLDLSWDASRPSVSGEAIRSGAPVVGRRLRSDPLLARWRDDARRLGYGAVSAFPLRIDDAVIGCMTLVATGEDAFDATEVALLSELADDLGYGIGHLRMQARQVEAERTIQRLAFEDPSTRLPNRAAMRETLRAAIARAGEAARSLAVLSIHVVHFDEISDTLGRVAGERLLVEAARRVCATASAENHQLARIGEDELLLLIHDADADHASALARRLAAALYGAVAFADVELDARAAIGIALHPEHGDDADELMRRAKVAMYRAGSGGFAVYSGLHDDERRRRLALLGDLRRAIAADELMLVCQPKVALPSERLCGAEALMRWRHPRHGMISPSHFVALAEDAGLITPLTHWVLEAAFRARRRWHERAFEQPLAVNLSPRDLHDPQLVERVRALVDACGTQPGWMQVEVTESALMEEPDKVIDTLRRLADLGIESMVDDYGTGYSSLRYLRELPVSSIKIDQSFVRRMQHDGDSAAIVRSTIELCHALSLRAIAEGVEDESAWRALRDEGCDAVQGYYVGKPLPVDEFPAWASTSRWTAGASARTASR